MRDTRTKWQLASYRAIEQARADQTLEKIWRERVRENTRRRLDRRVQMFIGGTIGRA